MKKLLIFISLLFVSSTAYAEMNKTSYTLSDAIEFAVKNNPRIIQSSKDVEIGTYGISEAKANKMPRLDFNSGATRYRYASPITPISGSPLKGSGFPEFDSNIYDFGVSFILPLYRGGRLDAGVTIAEIKKSIAEDMFRMSKQDLIYNLTNVYYKIYQLEKLLDANEASVKQLEAHKKNVELFLKAGTVPKVELLKTEVELAHAKQNAIVVRNSIESSYELLKTLMGIEDINRKISLVHENSPADKYPALEEATNRAFSLRPDYNAVSKKKKVVEEKVNFAQGKRLPIVYLSSEYSERSGDSFEFKENWNLALRLSVPIFDGGLIRSEISKEKKEMEKVREEERSLRLDIIREIKDSYLNIENAGERIGVLQKAVETAKENLRIEVLRYETGSGTSTDVIDSQTMLLRAETDYLQAIYDKNIAIASLRRAIGEDIYEEASK
ncbi:MAG: TolC family protein [Nitrospirota bacterium]